MMPGILIEACQSDSLYAYVHNKILLSFLNTLVYDAEDHPFLDNKMLQSQPKAQQCQEIRQYTLKCQKTECLMEMWAKIKYNNIDSIIICEADFSAMEEWLPLKHVWNAVEREDGEKLSSFDIIIHNLKILNHKFL